MAEPFGAVLASRIERDGPLAVGIDPSRELLEDWALPDEPESARHLGLRVIEALADVVGVIKVQVAFFERFGARGYVALEAVMRAAREAGLILIADAKRGDIGSTSAAYAEAWLAEGALACDALTVSAYVGLGALEPFMSLAESNARGIFVLAATSNVQAASIQDSRDARGLRVSDAVLEGISQRNARSDAHGVIGAVIGATRERGEFELATLGGPILVPGVGAQGASGEDVARVTRGALRASVLASVSRGILQSGPSRSALESATRRWRDELAAHLL